MLQHHPRQSKTTSLSRSCRDLCTGQKASPATRPAARLQRAGTVPLGGQEHWLSRAGGGGTGGPRTQGHIRRQNLTVFPLRTSSGWQQDPPAFSLKNPFFSQALHKLPKRSATEHPPSSSLEQINLRSWFTSSW